MVRVNCDQCSQTFITKKLFVSHLITKSCHKSIREAAKSQTRNKALQEENFDYPTMEIVPVQDCPGCRRFSKAGLQMYMLSHLASHVQSKAECFECEDCSLKFESVYFLEKHENKKHKKEKCDDCPKKFKIISLLQKHVEDIHRTEKCNDCDFNAKTKENLEKHIYNKHPKDICEECGMAFENQSAVDKHFQQIHEKIKCDDCEEDFETDELWDNHKVEVHNHSKTTFKQFGGGLMMMMISENTEPTEEQSGVEENVFPKSNTSFEDHSDVRSHLEESKDKVIDKEAVELSEENTVEDESTLEKKNGGDINELQTQNSSINVFGTGFFMMYAEDSEKLADKKHVEDPPQEKDSCVNKSLSLENEIAGQKNEEEPMIKRQMQTSEETGNGNSSEKLADLNVKNPSQEEDFEKLTDMKNVEDSPREEDSEKLSDKKNVEDLPQEEDSEKLADKKNVKDLPQGEDSSLDKKRRLEKETATESNLEEMISKRQKQTSEETVNSS